MYYRLYYGRIWKRDLDQSNEQTILIRDRNYRKFHFLLDYMTVQLLLYRPFSPTNADFNIISPYNVVFLGIKKPFSVLHLCIHEPDSNYNTISLLLHCIKLKTFRFIDKSEKNTLLFPPTFDSKTSHVIVENLHAKMQMSNHSK